MAAKYWIKLYHEILHDSKMGKMPDKLWRRTIELFLLAGELDLDGALPPIDEICWTLRISEEECNDSLHELQRLNVAHCNDDGTWIITHFADRQSASSSTERSRAHRQRLQREKQPARPVEAEKGATKMQRNVAPDSESDTDKESLPIGNGGEPPPAESQKAEKEGAGPKTVVRERFLELTHLSPPPVKSSTDKRWWGWFDEILTICNKDPAVAIATMERVIGYMQAEGLTISGPQSIVNLCRSTVAGQKLNGAPKNDTRLNPVKEIRGAGWRGRPSDQFSDPEQGEPWDPYAEPG